MGSALTNLGARAASQSDSTTLPFKLSVMLWTVFRDRPFAERVQKVASAGYHYVELVDEYRDWSDAQFREADTLRKQLGIEFDTIAGLKNGVVDPGTRDAFLKELTALIPVAQKLNSPAIIVLSGNRVDGMSHEQQHQACIETLKKASEIAERNHIQLLLENIDPIENPKYFLTSVAEGFQIVRSVNHPKVRFLYDFFHEQISEGNLITKLQDNIDLVGLVHVADVPGRHEPGTGEINYNNIYRALAKLKYDRGVAMEFLASGDEGEALRRARMEVHAAVSAAGAA